MPTFTLLPRFVLSLRQLYWRDVQGRRVDSPASMIVFVDAGQDGLGQDEGIRMEERKTRSAGSDAAEA